MPRKRLIWKVMPGYLGVIVLCTALVAWLAGQSVRSFHRTETARELHNKLNLILPQVKPLLITKQLPEIQKLCNELGPASSTRITVISNAGLVLGDSEQDPAKMDNHADRPEILDARTNGIGRSARFSETVDTEMLYEARSIIHDKQVIGFVRIAVSLDTVKQTLSSVRTRILAGGLVMAVIGVTLMLVVFARQIALPLHQLQEGAQRFASGDFNHTLPVPDSEEVGTLAEALNTMAQQLAEKIQLITQHSQEQQAILASMIEGVIAVDGQQRIITLNDAAAQLLNIQHQQTTGRDIAAVIRNADLQQFLTRALASTEPIEDTIIYHGGEHERAFQVQGTVLHNGYEANGAVVVLHEITRLRHLEAVRRQFVANVSHELKTPISAIKAAAETLIGSDRTPTDSENSERFLKIITRQADRLNAIVEDLLMIARIEQDQEQGQIELSSAPLGPVLASAVETCQLKATEKDTSVSVHTQTDLYAHINAPLLEQAVINLVDNAIKYSPPNTTVTVTAESNSTETVITVQDQGPGIAREHLQRIFERFYRTDQGRSRAMGGTGLGLAIVKHIAQAHRGRVSVDSTTNPAKNHGCIFRIHLPTDEA